MSIKVSLKEKIKLRLKLTKHYKRYRRLKRGHKPQNIKFNKKNEHCVVLGNGPSLKDDIKKIYAEKHDTVCVNHFAEHEDFFRLKPNIYVLIDSYFWAEETHDELKKKRDKFFESIGKASWHIQLFLPSSGNATLIRDMIDNDNVEVIQLRVQPCNKIDIKHMTSALAEGKLGPPDCNVLIYAIYSALLADYKSIDVYGADFSFHNDIQVDQKTNQLYMEYRHFYGAAEKQPLMINPDRKKPFTMRLMFGDIHLTLYAHELLNKFAKLKNIRIVNRSSNSFIDAYERE